MNQAPGADALFGRDDAVSVVGDLLAGGGGAVVVGDPGVGKSSLMRVAAELARHHHRRVLSVTPTQFERGLPFAGLAELVDQCPDELPQRLPEPQRRALAVALQRATPGTGQLDALAVPLAVRGLLTHLCEAGPVALLIDDLQWLDQASADTIGFAVRRLPVPSQRLSVLVATRPDAAAGVEFVRGLPEPRRELALRPLAGWAVGLLLRGRLGPHWNASRSARVAHASGGNPMLALEIARAVQASAEHPYGIGRPGDDPVFPVPPSLVGLLGERVARLAPEAREVLLLAAAAGRITTRQLAKVVDQAQLRSALEAGADAEVTTVGAGSVVAFAHPLLASAIYDAAAPAERRHAHRALAESLDDPVERARHRARSITAPDRGAAAELERAADISLGRGARQLAGELLEAAALATPTDPDRTEGLRRWLRAADTYQVAGDPLAARISLDKGALLATAPVQQAQVLMRRAQLADHLPGARALTERAFRLTPPGSILRPELLQMLSEYRRQEGHGMLALRLTRWAIAEAAAARRPDIQLVALHQRISIERHWGLDRSDRTLRDIDELAASSPAVSRTEWAWAHSFFAPWHDKAAERLVREVIAANVEAGRYGELSGMYICLILRCIRASDIHAAKVALDEADRFGAWAGRFFQSAMSRILVGEYSGDLDAAREHTRSALAESKATGLTYWYGGFLAQAGFIEVSARDWPAALEPLRELAGIFARTRMVDLEQLLWAVDYADAALQAGATAEVETAIAVLRRQAAAGRPEAAVAADRCQALLDAASGNTDEALATLRRIVDEPGAECPFESARSRLALGQVYRRAGHKNLANETLAAAADAFAALGTPRWAERARDDAERVGPRPSSGTLTGTERRVAELVGAGRSNQETAAELFMSVKSVEANLTRIYRKLSVRSRTELARVLPSADAGQENS